MTRPIAWFGSHVAKKGVQWLAASAVLAAMLVSTSRGAFADPLPKGGADAASSAPSVVKLVQENGAYHLSRNGVTFFIRGAGGDASKQLLKDCGGNSFRTWGSDNLGAQLDEAQKLGIGVTVGIWLGHKEHGFDYNNADQVADQYEMARKAILKYKDHPALLMWGIGNEMEIQAGADNAAVWSAINNIAAMAKKLDPNHPTMTVVAEIGGNKVKNINRLCPDIDIIGINSYGGGPSLAARYKAAGGVKPFVITEYGPPGVWEIGKNDWGAYSELTSTAKADLYRATYEKSIESQPLCLGSYAFAWGNKQEATATWFGLLLPNGDKLGAVDTLTQLWSGKKPAVLCPIIKSLKANGPDQVDGGGTIHVDLDASDPNGDPLTVKWVLQSDPTSYNSNGDTEKAPPTYPDAIAHADLKGVELHMPTNGGIYRLFAYISNGHAASAVGNVPLLVRGVNVQPLGQPIAASHGKSAKLPLVVYDEADRKDLPYAPSGYMGSVANIKMNDSCTDNPHAGKTCMQILYTAKDGWGGVVWQNPPNDWGDKPGGSDVTGATKLSFWARGDKGTESVTFLCGVIAKDKPYFDTMQTKLPDVKLTTEWKQYSIDLKGKDLTRVKSGFGWVVAATGEPITFYLDDIEFE